MESTGFVAGEYVLLVIPPVTGISTEKTFIIGHPGTGKAYPVTEDLLASALRGLVEEIVS